VGSLVEGGSTKAVLAIRVSMMSLRRPLLFFTKKGAQLCLRPSAKEKPIMFAWRSRNKKSL